VCVCVCARAHVLAIILVEVIKLIVAKTFFSIECVLYRIYSL
jgi:hypothetical protein